MRKSVNRELVAVIAIMGLGTLAMSILSPMLPLYLTSIGIAPHILGLMFSVSMVGMAFGEPCGGWIADKVGLRVPLSVGTFVCVPVMFCFVLTQSTPIIFFIFLTWGIVRAAIWGPGRGYIGIIAPSLKKATFMAILATMMSASRSLGTFPSGFIVDNLGYHWVFFISAGISLLGGILVVTTLKKARLVKTKPLAVSPSSSDKPSSAKQLFSYHPFIFQSLVAVFSSLEMGMSMNFLPLLATQVVGLTATEVGILFTMGGLVSVVLSIPIGMLADRKGKKIFMILGLLVSASGLAGTAFAASFPQLILFSIIKSLGMVMFGPAAAGLLSDTVPVQLQSTAMGIYGAAEDIGGIAGSALGGFIWSAWGPQATFLTGTVASGLGAVICFSLVKDKVSQNQ